LQLAASTIASDAAIPVSRNPSPERTADEKTPALTVSGNLTHKARANRRSLRRAALLLRARVSFRRSLPLTTGSALN
jgi:hypothetical protein